MRANYRDDDISVAFHRTEKHEFAPLNPVEIATSLLDRSTASRCACATG